MRGLRQRLLRYIPTLHPHIESLNSIKVFPFGDQDFSIYQSFIDLIVLDDIFDRDNKLNACFFINSELKEINPIYQSFKRIKDVYCYDYEGALEILNMINQTSIQEIENISFQYINSEDFEQITNQLLNYKIHTLSYLDEAVLESISNLALENISKINPQELHQLILNI